MSDFFRFPHTPHLAWLGSGEPRDDKVLSSPEACDLLASEVTIEEKLDGANIGFSLDTHGNIRVQNRGQYLIPPFSGQFSRLTAWLGQHREKLKTSLTSNQIMFGEWCAAQHSINYTNLPDWFLMFDIYDVNAGKFWSTGCRNELANTIGLKVVPNLGVNKISLADLKTLLDRSRSRYHEGPVEGLIVRKDSELWCEARAKLVRSDFTQAIEEHWSRRQLKWNKLADG